MKYNVCQSLSFDNQNKGMGNHNVSVDYRQIRLRIVGLAARTAALRTKKWALVWLRNKVILKITREKQRDRNKVYLLFEIHS